MNETITCTCAPHQTTPAPFIYSLSECIGIFVFDVTGVVVGKALGGGGDRYFQFLFHF